MVRRSFAAALAAALLSTGCSAPSRRATAVDAPPPAFEQCREVARQDSGYRGIPARTNSQIEQRMDEKWPNFVRAYELCMRERGHELDD